MKIDLDMLCMLNPLQTYKALLYMQTEVYFYSKRTTVKDMSCHQEVMSGVIVMIQKN